MSHFRSVFALLSLLLIISPTQAQLPSFGAGGDTPQYYDSRDQVTATVVAAYKSVPQGSDLPIAIIFDLNPGWHIWTQEGGTPEGVDVFDGAINTIFSVKVSTSGSLVLHDGLIQWPEPHIASVAGMGDFAVFEGRAIAYLPMTILEDAPLGEVTLTFSMTFQSCNESICLAPADFELPLTLEIVEKTDADSIGELSGDFANFDKSVFDQFDNKSAPSDAENPQPALVDKTSTSETLNDDESTSGYKPKFFGIELPSASGPLGVLLLAIMSMIGGFILNLTPCVLPVIPIKIMTISKHAEHPGRNLVLGLWMAFGVVAFWMGIGLPVAFVSSITDPSRIFGIWWLTLGIGLLIGGMGIGIMGLFMFRLPNSVYAINPKADTAWGSFLFGVMTAVLGLPCFGFIAGALLAGTATLPASTVVIIFTSIGIGMAAPYLVLAAKPSLVDRIPRTGPASELVKQVMGLLLLAAAAYFIGSGLIGLIAEQPYLAKQLHWWVVAILAVISGLWLMLRTFQITPNLLPRITFAIIGIFLGGVAVLQALDSTAKAKSIWEDRQSLIESNDAYTTKTWNDYTPATFAKAMADGHTVVLDFTAEWCLICKSLKAGVLNRQPVKNALAEDDVVSFTVDLTSRKDPGWKLLEDLGRTGIPLLVIYTPGKDEPWQSNAYTSRQVMDALSKARNQDSLAQR